jgi:hypothetical protein
MQAFSDLSIGHPLRRLHTRYDTLEHRLQTSENRALDRAR